MRTHRVKVHLTPNEPLTVPVPVGTPEGDVEVILVFPDAVTQPGTFSTLREFDNWLELQPPSGRSQEEMDLYLEQERAGWD